MSTAVLLSGGVDSSVALRLLVERGERELTAFYLKIWLEDDLSFLGECPWEEDLRYARAVCEDVGVQLEVLSLQREYYDRVVSYAIDELRAGRTPSPDIFCNQRIKFGAFVENVGHGFERIATGHYARILEGEGNKLLARGVDPVKDQTYFLSHLSRQQVEQSEFPLGEFQKSEVRAMAERFELPNFQRKDSQGICFLGKVRFNDFVRSYLGDRPGKIRERETGRVLGDHRGYWFHTLGQRKGLGLSQGPWFVVGKDLEENIVWVSHQNVLEQHRRRALEVTDCHWIHGDPGLDRLEVKLRHTPDTARCALSPTATGYEIELESGDTGAAPGQFCVFYDGDICLGGARIV